MYKLNLFLDSSALFAGIVSGSGAARVLLLLAESEHISLTISTQVVSETERAIVKKVPKALNDLRQAILASKARIVLDPPIEDVLEHLNLISHPADVSILLAAIYDHVDYLLTLNRKHFIDDPTVAQKSNLRIGTPGEALSWVREQLSTEHISEKGWGLRVPGQSSLLVLGIPTEYIDLLMESGVESVVELSKCIAKNLFERVIAVNEEKKIVRKTPTLIQIEGWVNQAKQKLNKVD